MKPGIGRIVHLTAFQAATKSFLLSRWAAKVRCRRDGPQRTADSLWRSLEPHLTEDEKSTLSTAVSHLWHDDQSPRELDDAAKAIQLSWIASSED